jgi:hypothetical protein
MPLIKSAKPAAIAQNIRTERAAGRPQKQSVAIAMSTADRAKRPSGQFAGQREKDGKMNGGGMAEPSHPQNHHAFEKL